MIDFKDLFEATRTKVISLIFIGLGSIGLMYPLREPFMEFIKGLTTFAIILVSLVLLIIGIGLNLYKKKEEKE